jgi:TolA-binding protein
VLFSKWCKNTLARIIRLILSGTLSFSFSTATAFSEEIKRAEESPSAVASDIASSSSKTESKSSSKSKTSTPVPSASKDSGPAAASESEASSESVPDLVTSIRALEVKVLGASPDSESIEDRLIAMEEKLFGKKLSGSLFERLIQIRQAITAKESPLDNVIGSTNASPETSAAAAAANTSPRGSKSGLAMVPNASTVSAVVSANSAPPAVANAKSKKPASAPAEPSRAEQLKEAHQLFDDKNYKGARKAMEAFIARNPLVYNGYYLLGLIDLKEHEPLPEYNQFAYNQFLKAYNLAPASPDCEFVCRYIVQVVRSQRLPDPRSVAISAKNSPVQALLNIGVNCFLRSDEPDARDLFEFIVKYCPGGAASANYNLGAMAEKHGQLKPALALYRNALTASYDRDALVSYKMLDRNDVDQLSAKLIARTVQRIELKIKANDRTWTGNEQEKGTPVSIRCTINRLSPTNIWADIFDAGDNQMQ